MPAPLADGVAFPTPKVVPTFPVVDAVSEVNAPVVGVVAPTVPLMLMLAVPVRLVTVPLAGIPRIAPLPKVATPVTPRVVLAVMAFAARVVLATVRVPVAAPTFRAVAAPAKLTVVAVVLTRAKVVDGVVSPVVTAGDVRLVVPVLVSVPVTASVLPEPTLSPTLVPVPAAANNASTRSRSVLTFVPQVSVLAPTSGLVNSRLVVVVSAIFSSYQTGIQVSELSAIAVQVSAVSLIAVYVSAVLPIEVQVSAVSLIAV